MTADDLKAGLLSWEADLRARLRRDPRPIGPVLGDLQCPACGCGWISIRHGVGTGVWECKCRRCGNEWRDEPDGGNPQP